MQVLIGLFATLSFLVGIVFLVMILIHLIRKKPVKKMAIGWATCSLLFIVCIFAFPTENEQTAPVALPNSEQTAPKENEKPVEEKKPEPIEEKKPVAPAIPTEYRSALKKAETYSSNMHMSKKGIYDQLTSEHGEQFSAEAAQYAIDNIKADFNLNALKKAETYQSSMNMSPKAIRDQLTSEHGEQFTPEEAEYAIQNLK